jgi:DNA-binding ferritin-like protein (Dps family)
VHALTARNIELEAQVQELVGKAIESFDLGAVVTREVHSVLEREVKAAVSRAVSAVLWNDETREQLQTVVREALKR